jgi:hypothetical protein
MHRLREMQHRLMAIGLPEDEVHDYCGFVRVRMGTLSVGFVTSFVHVPSRALLPCEFRVKVCAKLHLLVGHSGAGACFHSAELG